ncbi:CsbD family protein [Xanthomonas oryzae pv. oryzae]
MHHGLSKAAQTMVFAPRVTGDKSTELEGAAEKNVGKVQRKAGEVADNVRDAVKSTK